MNCFQNFQKFQPVLKRRLAINIIQEDMDRSGKTKAKLREHWIDWMAARFRVRSPVQGGIEPSPHVKRV